MISVQPHGQESILERLCLGKLQPAARKLEEYRVAFRPHPARLLLPESGRKLSGILLTLAERGMHGFVGLNCS